MQGVEQQHHREDGQPGQEHLHAGNGTGKGRPVDKERRAGVCRHQPAVQSLRPRSEHVLGLRAHNLYKF
ncbi:hypothetical protein GCM10023170_036550 [Phytohabitans houttuyneae]|uniref:Uncharacterized protein n=1 Tax=Phytohabitans houttuyneae TaxID=1076126 RepID=A0A6V8KVS4_9ACTN|nr:hypothetical protein Phou_088550 [Phytohabitans houttuyneae]